MSKTWVNEFGISLTVDTESQSQSARILHECLLEAGDDVEAGLSAAKYILAQSSQPIFAYLSHDIHNRRAQGILNRALSSAKGLSTLARKDLAAAIKSNSGDAIVLFVNKYRLQLANLLTTTQMAALLEGAVEVASKVPPLGTVPIEGLPITEQERILSTPPAPFSLPRGTLEEQSPHFPTIDKAVQSLSSRNVLTRPQYDALDASARAKAFTVAGVDAQATLTKIRDVLATNVAKGASYEAFKQEVLSAVDSGTFLSDAHQETVFRTNVQSAFSDGQASVLAHPLIRSGFPYSTYDAIHDDRVREDHLALEKYGISGTNIYRNDDPVFQMFRPPWDYNDRCSWTPITVRQAAERGIPEAQEWLKTGVEPSVRAFVPMPPFEPPAGFQRALEGLPLSIRLSLQPMASFGFDPAETRAPAHPNTYQELLEHHKGWEDRSTEREDCRKCADKAILIVRGRGKLDKADEHLEGAGATSAKLRAIARMRHRVESGRDPYEALEDIYEEAYEEVHRRLDEEDEVDIEPDEPEMPAFALDESGHAHKGKGAGGGQFTKSMTNGGDDQTSKPSGLKVLPVPTAINTPPERKARRDGGLFQQKAPPCARPDLSDEEKSSVKSYCWQAYRSLNEGLRGDQKLDERNTSIDSAMRSSLNKVKIFSKPIEVLRGVTLDPKAQTDLVNRLEQARSSGGTIEMKGWMSTTMNDTLSEDSSDNVVMHIQAVHGLDASGISPMDENELTLPSESHFAPVNTSRIGGKLHIFLRQLPPPPPDLSQPRKPPVPKPQKPSSFLSKLRKWIPFSNDLDLKRSDKFVDDSVDHWVWHTPKVALDMDVGGHQHRGKGTGGGQFTKGSNGNTSDDDSLPPDLLDTLPQGLAGKLGMMPRLRRMAKVANARLAPLFHIISEDIIPNAWEHARNALVSTAVPGVPVNDILVAATKVIAWAWFKVRGKSRGGVAAAVDDDHLMELIEAMYEMLGVPEGTPLPKRGEASLSLAVDDEDDDGMLFEEDRDQLVAEVLVLLLGAKAAKAVAKELRETASALSIMLAIPKVTKRYGKRPGPGWVRGGTSAKGVQIWHYGAAPRAAAPHVSHIPVPAPPTPHIPPVPVVPSHLSGVFPVNTSTAQSAQQSVMRIGAAILARQPLTDADFTEMQSALAGMTWFEMTRLASSLGIGPTSNPSTDILAKTRSLIPTAPAPTSAPPTPSAPTTPLISVGAAARAAGAGLPAGGQRARAVSIAAHGAAMAKLNAGQPLTAADKADLATKLTNMPTPLLHQLHGALGGTGAVAGRQAAVAAVRAIITGGASAPAPATPALAPVPPSAASATALARVFAANSPTPMFHQFRALRVANLVIAGSLTTDQDLLEIRDALMNMTVTERNDLRTAMGLNQVIDSSIAIRNAVRALIPPTVPPAPTPSPGASPTINSPTVPTPTVSPHMLALPGHLHYIAGQIRALAQAQENGVITPQVAITEINKLLNWAHPASVGQLARAFQTGGGHLASDFLTAVNLRDPGHVGPSPPGPPPRPNLVWDATSHRWVLPASGATPAPVAPAPTAPGRTSLLPSSLQLEGSKVRAIALAKVDGYISLADADTAITAALRGLTRAEIKQIADHYGTNGVYTASALIDAIELHDPGHFGVTGAPGLSPHPSLVHWDTTTHRWMPAAPPSTPPGTPALVPPAAVPGAFNYAGHGGSYPSSLQPFAQTMLPIKDLASGLHIGPAVMQFIDTQMQAMTKSQLDDLSNWIGGPDLSGYWLQSRAYRAMKVHIEQMNLSNASVAVGVSAPAPVSAPSSPPTVSPVGASTLASLPAPLQSVAAQIRALALAANDGTMTVVDAEREIGNLISLLSPRAFSEMNVAFNANRGVPADYITAVAASDPGHIGPSPPGPPPRPGLVWDATTHRWTRPVTPTTPVTPAIGTSAGVPTSPAATGALPPAALHGYGRVMLDLLHMTQGQVLKPTDLTDIDHALRGMTVNELQSVSTWIGGPDLTATATSTSQARLNLQEYIEQVSLSNGAKPKAKARAKATTPTTTTPLSTKEETWETGVAKPGTLNGIPFAPAPHHFWEKTPDVDIGEPKPLKPVNRASVMVQEPDGRVWVVHVTNEYGRKYTIPGGGVEAGLTDQQNALKEVWEETGLQVEITGHLGDFEDSNNQNNGRLYIGRRIGGAPWGAKIESKIINQKTGKPAAESDVVHLVSPERASQLLHRTDDLASLMTVRPIPLDTPVKGAGSEPLKKLVAALAPRARAYDAKQAALGITDGAGNGELHAVQEMRGFNKPPTLVSEKDFDKLVAAGNHIEMLRGLKDVNMGWRKPTIKADDLANAFRSGENFPGHGIFGSGTYADSNKGYGNVSTSYAGSSGAVIRMALPKTAKIIKVSDLEKAVPTNPKAFEGYQNKGGKQSYECWMGVQAALAGYDAIFNDDQPGTRHRGYGKGFYVVLNRSALVVQETNAKSGHRIT